MAFRREKEGRTRGRESRQRQTAERERERDHLAADGQHITDVAAHSACLK